MRARARDLMLGVVIGLVGPTGLFAWLVERHNRELRRLTRRLEALSTADPLTGLPNRRAFDARARDELARASRYGADLSMVLMDLDHFKAVNDRHGHATGDAVLRRVAAILERERRRGDLVVRLGGEEFVAVLPHTGARAALAWAERVRRLIAGAELKVDGQTLRITASFGVAQAQGEDEPERLLAAADRALYAAKAMGRNRVVCGRLRPAASGP